MADHQTMKLIVHKRALRVLLGDYGSTFKELLQKRGEHNIHTRNIHKNSAFESLQMPILKKRLLSVEYLST